MTERTVELKVKKNRVRTIIVGKECDGEGQRKRRGEETKRNGRA